MIDKFEYQKKFDVNVCKQISMRFSDKDLASKLNVRLRAREI